MDRKAIAIVIVAAAALSSCSALDGFFGVDPQAPPGAEQSKGSSPADTIGSIASVWVPWAGAALSALGGLYAAFRKRQYWKALNSVAKGVNSVKSDLDASGKVDVEKLMKSLADQQDQDGVRDLVRALVHDLEKKK